MFLSNRLISSCLLLTYGLPAMLGSRWHDHHSCLHSETQVAGTQVAGTQVAGTQVAGGFGSPETNPLAHAETVAEHCCACPGHGAAPNRSTNALPVFDGRHVADRDCAICHFYSMASIGAWTIPVIVQEAFSRTSSVHSRSADCLHAYGKLARGPPIAQ